VFVDNSLWVSSPLWELDQEGAEAFILYEIIYGRAFNLSCAFLKKSSSFSIPIAERPIENAVKTELAEPNVGSSTVPPGGQYLSIRNL